MGIQDIVYNLEEGGGSIWIRRIAIVIGFIGLTLWFDIGLEPILSSHFHGLDNPEAMDAAQLGREIARGHGFTTHVIRPIVLAELRDHQAPAPSASVDETPTPPLKLDFNSFPDTYNPPLYPLALALVFKICNVDFKSSPEAHIYSPEIAIIVFGQLCIALTAFILFQLAKNIFDERVAWVSTGVFLLSGLTWKFSISGTAIPLTLLLLTASFYTLHRALLNEESEEGGGKVWGWLLGSGILLALAALTDYAVLWLLPIYLIAVGFSFRGRWISIPTLLTLWLVILLPWGIRNADLTGDLLGSHSIRLFEDGSMFPGTTLERSYRPDPIKTETAFFDIRTKVVRGLRYHTDEGIKLLGSTLTASLFFAGFFHLFRRKHAQVLRYFTLIGLIVLAIGASLIDPTPEATQSSNYLFLLSPMTMIFGVAFFFILVDRIESYHTQLQKVIIGVFIAVNTLSLILTLAPPKPAPFAYPPYFPPILSFISQWNRENETIAADIPWATAWYTDRPSLWLPVTMKEYTEINDYVNPVTGLLLTPESRNAKSLLEIEKGEWKDWALTIHGASIPANIGFSAATFLPPDKSDYLLISDRKRWNPQ